MWEWGSKRIPSSKEFHSSYINRVNHEHQVNEFLSAFYFPHLCFQLGPLPLGLGEAALCVVLTLLDAHLARVTDYAQVPEQKRYLYTL